MNNLSDSEKYNLYREVRKSGGPCPICGWKDGDGVKACFYSKEYGQVTHQNSEKMSLSKMNDSERSLWTLRSALLYPDSEARERSLEQKYHEAKEREAEWYKTETRPFRVRETGEAYTEEQFHEEYSARVRAESLGSDEPYCHWIRGEYWQGKYHYYQPHLDCGGLKIGVGPYHVRCSKCGLEVKGWEFGIDYDIG